MHKSYVCNMSSYTSNEAFMDMVDAGGLKMILVWALLR